MAVTRSSIRWSAAWSLQRPRERERATRASPLLYLFQLERVVNDLQRLGAVFFRDDATDLDLAGRDVLDVHLRVGQRAEHALGDASVRAHADADHAHLRQ